MSDLLCPFGATQVQNDFGCKHAYAIIRRGGEEIACKQEGVHQSCCALHARIKSAALDTMELEDDLLTLPHSVMVKIQFGGLLGLQTIVGSQMTKNARIEDISVLITEVVAQFADMNTIPYEIISSVIVDYKLQRRSRKKT